MIENRTEFYQIAFQNLLREKRDSSVAEGAFPAAATMEQPVPVKEVKILETAEDIQERREQVLRRYLDFKEAARVKREKLEDSRRFQYFRRDADELESWIYEKLQAASDESYKDPTNLQVRLGRENDSFYRVI